MDAELWLQRHDIPTILSDVVGQLVAERSERPVEAIADYFERVHSGSHVLGRDFAYVNSTAHNRRCFVRLLVETLRPLEGEGDDAQRGVTAEQLLDLIGLLCEGVPLALVQRALSLAHAAALLGPQAAPPAEHGADLPPSAPQAATVVSMPLRTALLAVGTQLLFAEFLNRALEIFRACDTRGTGSVNRNVLCLTLRQMMALNSWPFATPPLAIVDRLQLLSARAPNAAAAAAGAAAGGSSGAIVAAGNGAASAGARLDGGVGTVGCGGVVELTVREFECLLLSACMAHGEGPLLELLTPPAPSSSAAAAAAGPHAEGGAGLHARLGGGGDARGGAAELEDELELQRRKAEIRASWARRRSSGTQGQALRAFR
jgi:hypothetical protein